MPFLDDLTSAIGLASGITAALLGGYFLLRSAEPAPAGCTDAALRRLMGGQDSLAYFALRPDKSVDEIDTVATVTALYEGLQHGSELLVTAGARTVPPEPV